MVTRVRTIDFLPEIFKTNTNKQFLAATLDQLVQQPNHTKLQGYIGSKFGYGIDAKDKYVAESSKIRNDYQLEPAVIFKKKDTNVALDMITYPGIVDAIALESGVSANHNTLFSNEYYSWDSFVDLDKLINYSQYYWVPGELESVVVSTSTLFYNLDFTVSGLNTYQLTSPDILLDDVNPTLTLVRGGTYSFFVNQNSNFWIQTLPGVDGVDPTKTNVSTREVLGVENNGTNNGTVTFTVPLSSDQDVYASLGEEFVDLATTLKFEQVNGRPLSELKNIDGVTGISGKTLMFYGSNPSDIGYISEFFDSKPYDTEVFESGTPTSINSNFYKITLVGDPNNPVISLSEARTIPNDTKISVRYGDTYIARNFSRNTDGEIVLLPIVTARLDTLYYQDSSIDTKFGKILLVDKQTDDVLRVDNIIGSKSYVSSNGIKFTNGLKVKFLGNVHPTEYYGNEYFVEGVGTSINLVPVVECIVPEPFTQSFSSPYESVPFDTDAFDGTLLEPYAPDYITINRSSLNKNAWARSNRWFHVDVLKTIVDNNVVSPIASAALASIDSRAKRPVIEFYPNLKLFNSGTSSKAPVDFIDFTATDALAQISGLPAYNGDIPAYRPDGATSELFDGARIIFANDNNIQVRNKIYVVNIVKLSDDAQPSVSFSVAYDGEVQYDEQTVITKGETYVGQSYYFDGSNWKQAQFKDRINQPPTFDLVDSNGISLGDSSYYPGTDFTGCTLFQYSIGTGNDDPVLMFPIKYSGVNNLGDISFDVTLNTQTFNYVYNNVSVNELVNIAYVYEYTSRTEYTRRLGWKKAVEKSFQYQVFNLVYTSNMTSPTFVCDVAAKDSASTVWPTVSVYINNERIDATQYTVVVSSNKTTVTLTTAPADGTPIEVLIYSDQTSTQGYFQIPSNFDHNPFNEEITVVNMGDLKGHYKSILNNVSGSTGVAFGANNYRDLGDVIPYGTRIVQNSAPLTVAAGFLRNKQANFFDAMQYNSNEYAKFKATLIDTVNRSDYDGYQTAPSMLDDVLDRIVESKTEENPFFWSDMLPTKNPLITKTYSFKNKLDTSVYPLSRVYDFKNANYYSVLVYITRLTSGLPKVIQLVKGIDYFISETEKSITVTRDLISGDTLTIKEYDQTYGSHVPNTPTKLGFYPAHMPEVILDDTYITPTYFIKGHDGSYTRVYGEIIDGELQDFRDRVLFEYETRVYNNLKVDAKIPLTYEDIFPGQYRSTEYTYEEIQTIYSTYFLNWVGVNRLEYVPQYYDTTNEYTWNYSNAVSKADDKKFLQGNWRGIYLWLYDTIYPDSRPWEMLGLASKPSWWESRYGEAPYTSDNTLLWNDMSNGYVWNNNNPYIDNKRVRPGMIIPVDSTGKKVGPFVGTVASYDYGKFEQEWKIGDVAPTEFAYLRSSSFPFDLMRIFAATKPAQFFTLGMDLDVYKYNDEFQQYLVYNRYRTTPKDLIVYGTDNTAAAHSYFNWVVDYLQQYGINGSETVFDLINSLDVRLSYRVAGFSDKNLLSFYVEKGSPNSRNTSMLIPDESYSVMLYDNQPNDTITFSSVIVQRTDNGYKVYGNSQNKAYFTIATPIINGNYDKVTVGNLNVAVAKNYQTRTKLIPYGTEFTSPLQISEFLRSYGEHLRHQGMIFEDSENGIQLDWNQMIAELLYWIQSGWDVGSTVNVNPCANQITVDKDSLVVQPLTVHKDNFVLNQNLIPISIKDMAIERDGTLFSAKTLNKGDSISLFKANLGSIEHVVVFDNYTVFDDVLFNLVTGLRQQRLYVKGSKTAEWNGTLNAAGFILNQDDVEDWKSNVKYSKGVIVKYKREYWIANKVTIAPSATFDYNDWVKTSYEDVQKGLLPNPSTRAFESSLYYDTSRANLETDGDILGYSLIGYRPRGYLADGNLDDISQINVYQSMIEGKGTRQTAAALQGITLQQNTLNYTFNENWAIKNSEYGGVLSQNFVEFTLDETQLTGNPSIVELSTSVPTDGVEQTVYLSGLKNYGRSVDTNKVLPLATNVIDQLPTAGYVHMDDVRYTGYKFNDLNNADIAYLYKNDYIWVADKNGAWDVYTPVSMENTIKNVINNLNGTVSFVFEKAHGLSEDDPFGVINFNTNVDGYYTVLNVIDTRSLIVSLSLPKSVNTLAGIGLAFKLQSQRVSGAEGLLDLPLLNANYVKNRVWVDKDGEGDWEVLNKVNAYKNRNFSASTFGHTTFGSQVAYVPKLGFFITDPGEGKMYQYRETGGSIILARTWTESVSYGASISYNDDTLVVGAPHIPVGDDTFTSMIYVYKIVKFGEIQTLVEEEKIPFTTDNIGSTLEISGDSTYLYASVPDANSVLVFKRDNQPTYYPIVYQEGTTTIVIGGQTYVVPKDNYVTLAAQTVYGDRQFVASGDQTSRLPSGKKIVFTSLSRTIVGQLKEATINNKNYFKLVGDRTSVLTAGDKIAFTAHEIYTVVSTGYVSSGNYTTVNLAQAIAEVAAIPAEAYVNEVYITEPLTVVTGKYDASTDLTTFFTAEKIPYTTPSGYKVCTVSEVFTVLSFINTPFSAAGDKFSFSMTTNHDSSKLFIGAPKADFAKGVANVGYIYCYDRLVESWQVQYDVKPTDFYVMFMPFAPNETSDGTLLPVSSSVYVDGVKVDPNKYAIIHNMILMGPQKAGTIITVSSNRYVLTQQLTSYEDIYGVRPGQEFGYSADTNLTGSELIVGAPSNMSTENVEGAVYRFTHEGKRYGRITGLVQPNLYDATYILLNGYSVQLVPEVISATRITPGYAGYTITELGTTDWVSLGAESAGDALATISGTTMTVAKNTFGKVYIDSQVAGGGAAAGTLVQRQLTSTIANSVTKTGSSVPGQQLNLIALNNTTDIVTNMLVVGTNVPANTVVTLVDPDANAVILSNYLTADINNATINFYSSNTNKTHVNPGTSGTRKIIFDDVTGLIPRQFDPVTGLSFYQLVLDHEDLIDGSGVHINQGTQIGTGIPGAYMYIESINGNEVTLNSVDYDANTQTWYEENVEGQPLVTSLTANASGTYKILDRTIALSQDGTSYSVVSGASMYKKVAGEVGTTTIPLNNTDYVQVGHIVSGHGVPAGTFVKSITNNVVKLQFTDPTNQTLTASTAEETSPGYQNEYWFKQTGSVGTYTVSLTQNITNQPVNFMAIGTTFTASPNAVGNGTGKARESANAFVIANQINMAQVINVFAYATEDGRLVIRLLDMNLNQTNNKLSISEFNGNYLYQLGISEYIKTQVITDPNKQQQSRFGHTVKFNQYNSFAVGAPTSDRFVGTQFDFSDDENTHNDTVFDNNLTQFEDKFNDAGSVFVYDYVQSYNESLTTPGQFVYSQTCNDNNLDVGSRSQYGSAIAFNDYALVVGAPNFKPDTVGGKAFVFKNDTMTSGWHVYRKPNKVVDVHKIQKAQLYNNIDNSMEASLDYIDPLQGKMLGAVRENIDFISASDPAGYNNAVAAKGNMVWGKKQVGKIWFDTTSTKYMNYHQNDTDYNSIYWGKVFPGSVVTVYSWIESDVAPVNYVGTGTPFSLDNYSIAFQADANHNLATRYYYWVRNTNTLFSQQGKTLTDTVLEQYITDPQQSGIAYLAPLDQNVFALYNARSYINGTHTNLHLGFNDTEKDIANHAEFKLIRTDFPEDFLPGFPNKVQGYTEPSGLYDKFLSSLAGTDTSGNILPDPSLPKLQQIGISNKPRQSMFVNRFEALRNYLEYANDVLKTIPINEYGSLTFLHAQGDTYDTTQYWENVYWWQTGYSNTTKAAFEVPVYADLLRITPKENLIVGVTANGQGKREIHLYSNGAWSRIGLEDGTIQFLPSLWDYTTYKIGFGDNFFDTVPFDSYPSVETRYIIRALNEQIYTEALLAHRNKSLILMFEYIQSEAIDSNNFMPWLNKTSFADVAYTVRELTQGQKYQRDNENLISGYVNEVKPYHVVIKDFFLKYTAVDTFNSAISDFDLPAQYNVKTDRFESPVLVSTTPENSKEHLATDAVWDNVEYSSWLANYALTITDKPDYEITRLAKYLSKNDSKIKVASARGLPIIGIVKIGDELIGYASVDRDTGTLTELTRGLNNSQVVDHLADTIVKIDLPGVIVLDAGRDYIDPPEVTAYIDTTKYPEPRVPAVLKSVMAGGRVVGVEVINPGEGYVTAPEITFANSFEITFSEAQINFIDHTVLVPTTQFETGDLIHVTSENGKAIPTGYYYVYVVATLTGSEIISVTLHDNFADSIKGDNKIVFPGTEFVSADNTYTFGISARAIPVMINDKVRGVETTLRFDRTSYQARVVPWTPGEYWSSPYVSIGNDTSSPTSLFYTIPYDVGTSALRSSDISEGGADAVLTINNMKLGGTYYATVKEAGTNYVLGDSLVFKGSSLGGSSSTENDCSVVVTSTGFDYYTSQDHPAITPNAGSGAMFYITAYTDSQDSMYTVTLDPYHRGTGYAVGDRVKIYGSNLQGTAGQDPELYDAYLHNDIVITVQAVSSPTGVGPISEISFVGTPSGKGGIVAVDVSGVAYDPNLASLQGAVMPITSVGKISGTENATVTVNLDASGLKVGQIQGVPVYFYERPDLSFYEYDDTAGGGAYIRIYKPKFNPFSVSNQYFMQIGVKTNNITGEYDPASFGSIYYDNYPPIVIDGGLLGGASGKNDAIIRIRYAESGAITSATISGTAPTMFDIYYIKPVTDDTLQVFSDYAMTKPVTYSTLAGKYPGSTAPYTHFAYIPEPLVTGLSYKYTNTSLVSFNGDVYKCIDSNSSQVFNPSEWEKLESDDRALNALDRIMAYYEPASTMPAKDLAQLVRGITYPHPVYFGNKFAPEDMLPIDYEIQSETFYPRDVNITGIAASKDNDGNVIGYIAVGDSATHSVYMLSDDGITWSTHILGDRVLNTTGITVVRKLVPGSAPTLPEGNPETPSYSEDFIVSTMNPLTPIMLTYDKQHWITTGRTTGFDSLGWDVGGFNVSPLTVPQDSINSVNFANDSYFAVGSGILRSMDGVVWEKIYDFNSKLRNQLHKIAYVSTAYTECYIAVGGGFDVISGAGTSAPSFATTSRIVTSIDGLTWALQRKITDSTLYAVSSSSSVIVVGGENGEIWYIQNGVNWSNASISTLSGDPITATIKDITFAESVFVAVGDNGVILTSGDGMSWTQQASHTTRALNDVYHDGSKFYAMGDSATILRSLNGLVWADISYLATPDVNNVIKGSEFLYGYGPEELVAGVVTDSLSMRVVTAPGAPWDDEETVQTKLNQNTGFNMVTKVVKPVAGAASFDKMVQNPAQLAVFVMDDVTGLGNRIYERFSGGNLSIMPNATNPLMYEIDWVSKLITLVVHEGEPLTPTQSLMIEVYEIGNGRQVARSSTDYTPLYVNEETDNSEFRLSVQFNPLTTTAVVFKDGKKLVVNTDYYLTYGVASYNYAKIVFNESYDADVNYITFAVFETTVNDVNPTEFTYSVPETEVFLGGTNRVTIANSFIGVNAQNAIVEVNGIRQIYNDDYTINVNTKTVTFNSSFLEEELISVTTFHDTNRQYMQTALSLSLSVKAIDLIDTVNYPIRVQYEIDPEFAPGALVRFDGLLGNNTLNNAAYYMKRVENVTLSGTLYYQYEVYTGYNLLTSEEFSPIGGMDIGEYNGGGFTWIDSDTLELDQLIDPILHPTMDPLYYADEQRTWATVRGLRVNPSKLRYQDMNNKLNLLVPTVYGDDDIMITSMVNGATPNQMTFTLDVDKFGISSVYRENESDTTWLTEEINPITTSISVRNVRNIVDLDVQKHTVILSGSTKLVYVNADVSTVKQVYVKNLTTSTTVNSANYSLVIVNSLPAVVFTSGVSVGNLLEVTIRTGDVLLVDNERIRYTLVDLENNTISGLTRGSAGTSIADLHTVNTIVYGFTPNKRLPDKFYGVTWNDPLVSVSDSGKPLQISNTDPAKFLRNGNI